MTASLFVDGWTVRAFPQGESVDVRLPHDAMISEPRAAENPSGYHASYFAGGRYLYEKRWTPDPSPRTALLFEGVYGDTRVRLNGTELAHIQSPYREFVIELDSALVEGENHLEVDVDNSEVPNSRWYTGSGIYRPVWQITSATAHFTHDGVSVRTLAASSIARLEVRTQVEGELPDSAVVHVVLKDGGTTVAEQTGSIGSFPVELADARLWSEDDPYLYDVEVRLLVDEGELDRVEFRTGIRTVAVDARNGLRVNGSTVKLRGACVHHDSGILGAATFPAAELRRARILKANGYNAIRSSHNPLSRDLLNACDEVGLYVLDELTDVWFAPKTPHDHVERFETLWPDDVRSMVAKDRNHPSVVMYSIGNEIAELGLPKGVETSRRISELVHSLDPDRPTTVAANFLLSVLASRGKSMFQTEEKPHAAEKKKKPSAVTSTAANVISNKIGFISQLVSKLPAADKATRDAFPTVDIAGYNYAWSRYRGDAKRYPDRVVLGTESMPGDLPRIWGLVTELPNVIGDFAWTGWDHLGEAGLGTWAYGDEPVPLTKPYPQLISGAGTIDITGHPGAETLLARAVWGQLDAPAIAVRPLDRAGLKVVRVAWRATDAIESWAWRGKEGTRAEVEVYADADQVELLINGRSLGRRRVTDFVARFRLPYESGTLTAVAYRGGKELGRSDLRSSDGPVLALEPESHSIVADGQDLCFVRVEMRDAAGVVEMLADEAVELELNGPAVLAGFGSGAPATEESFLDSVHRTYYGRALVALRSTGEPGTITLTARSSRGERTISIKAVAVGTAALVR